MPWLWGQIYGSQNSWVLIPGVVLRCCFGHSTLLGQSGDGHRDRPSEDPIYTWHQQVVQAALSSPGMNDLLEGDHCVP